MFLLLVSKLSVIIFQDHFPSNSIGCQTLCGEYTRNSRTELRRNTGLYISSSETLNETEYRPFERLIFGMQSVTPKKLYPFSVFTIFALPNPSSRKQTPIGRCSLS